MKAYQLIILLGFAALLAGFLAGHFHFGPVESFSLWGIVAIAIGFFTENKKEIWISGLSFGFILTFAFMLSAFGGTSDKLPSYLLLTLVISIAGIIGSTITIFVANFLKRRFFKRNTI
jgi:predicted membrane protein